MKQNYIRSVTTIAVAFTAITIGATAPIELRHQGHFDELKAEGRPMVLDFYANWCGVCKRVKPDVERLAAQHPDINFILINVDKFGGLKNIYRIRAYPTFVFLDVHYQEVDRVVGRDVEKMKKSIEKIKKTRPAAETKILEVKTPAQPTQVPALDIKPIEKKPVKPAEVKKPVAIKSNHIELESEEQFNTLSAQSKPMVIDFFTTWCGPCKTMKPVIAELAKEYTDVNFVMVDAEKFPAIAKKYPVTGYPTFIFLDAMGKQVDKHSGTAAPILMKGKINKATGKNGGGVIVMEESEVIQKMPTQKMKVEEVRTVVKEIPVPARRTERRRFR